MQNKTFGFIIGNGFPIEIKETTEKKALIKFINRYWERIDKNGLIELCGLLETKQQPPQ